MVNLLAPMPRANTKKVNLRNNFIEQALPRAAVCRYALLSKTILRINVYYYCLAAVGTGYLLIVVSRQRKDARHVVCTTSIIMCCSRSTSVCLPIWLITKRVIFS
jgi:hypothetical protein